MNIYNQQEEPLQEDLKEIFENFEKKKSTRIQ